MLGGGWLAPTGRHRGLGGCRRPRSRVMSISRARVPSRQIALAGAEGHLPFRRASRGRVLWSRLGPRASRVGCDSAVPTRGRGCRRPTTSSCAASASDPSPARGEMARAWPRPTYRVHHVFHAPIEFVFRWCTDYTEQDAKYEAETYQRRILRRSRREVVYEDLEDTQNRWVWSRHVVRLFPPSRWHSDSVGSDRSASLDYRLRKLAGNRTELVLTVRRHPTPIGGRNPPKAQWERYVGESWVRFGRALERDFRKSAAVLERR